MPRTRHGRTTCAPRRAFMSARCAAHRRVDKCARDRYLACVRAHPFARVCRVSVGQPHALRAVQPNLGGLAAQHQNLAGFGCGPAEHRCLSARSTPRRLSSTCCGPTPCATQRTLPAQFEWLAPSPSWQSCTVGAAEQPPPSRCAAHPKYPMPSASPAAAVLPRTVEDSER